MSERVLAQPQMIKAPVKEVKDSFSMEQAEKNQAESTSSFEMLFNPGFATFTLPRFGFDFCQVAAVTGSELSIIPILNNKSTIQRSPSAQGESGTSPCPECSEGSSDQNSEVLIPEPEESETSSPFGSTAKVSPDAAEKINFKEASAPILIVNDEAGDLLPGQMRKSNFLVRLWKEVRRVIDEALAGTGRDTRDCPYLDYWFGFYSRQNNIQIERSVHRYIPEATNITAADEYIHFIAQRVRQAAEIWTRTGKVSNVPEEMLGRGLGLLGGLGHVFPGIGRMFFKTKPGKERKIIDPRRIQHELGEGQPLESGVRTRMEPVFGRDFSHVRAHSDSKAGDLSNNFNARAFTVGDHVAFGSGEYRPGTMVGDALIAHELAHVVQQGGSDASVAPKTEYESNYNDLEADADRSAVGVVGSLWSGIKEKFKPVSHSAIPCLRSGLSLQRCKKETTTEKTSTEVKQPEKAKKTEQSEPKPEQKPEKEKPSIELNPGKQVTRGQSIMAKVSFNPVKKDTLKITGWEYTTNEKEKVIRPQSDADFQTQWNGQMVNSGKLEIKYNIPSEGGNPGAEETIGEDIVINNRTDPIWQSNITEESENNFIGQPSPPVAFRQLGTHKVDAKPLPAPTPQVISNGPNNKFSYVGSLTPGIYKSIPLIHPDFKNSKSKFYEFHQVPSILYLIINKKKKLIPNSEYSNLQLTGNKLSFDVPDWDAFYKKYDFFKVTASTNDNKKTITLDKAWWKLASNSMDADIKISDEGALRNALGISNKDSYKFDFEPLGAWEGSPLMQTDEILKGTRSHEYVHNRHSHRANFKAIMRALDPQQKIENTVSTPDNPVDFNIKISEGWKKIEETLESHELVDESSSKKQEKFVPVSGETMAEINIDPGTGKSLGSVWNIKDDKPME